MITPALLLALALPRSIPYGGTERTYRIYRPAGLSNRTAVPLVVVLHGGFGTGKQAEESYGWDDAANEHHFVVVYPDGIDRAWHAGPACCGKPLQQNVDDVGFLTALIRSVSSEEHIDPKRIMITGMSNGAMMAYRMACESSLALRAIGSVSGTMLVPCADARGTSVMEIHGTADRNVPFDGGQGQGPGHITTSPIPDVVARWRSIDGCASPTTAAADVVTTTTARCGTNTVTLIAVTGAGHQWPGSKPPSPAWVAIVRRLGIPGLDQPSTALNATEMLCAFFGLTR